ncbi:transcription factor ash2 [Plakobranchus ocellatus]|uniref:Transcription factor ash2 n=1 Tax=Plakobranchus ocellatus TaxID=259542 RepID=A0AAV4DDA9_9GAST|nr:transcription factor ash2 [Plakobranchus ocellatus]
MYVPSKNDDFVDSIETRLLDQYLLRHEHQREHVRSSRDAISPCLWKPCFPEYQPCHANAISECQTFNNKSMDKDHDFDFHTPNDSLWSCRDSYPYRVISRERSDHWGLSYKSEHASKKKTSSCRSSCSPDRSQSDKLSTDRESEWKFGGVCKVKILQNTSRTVDFGCAVYRQGIHSPCLQLDGLRYERSLANSDSLGSYYDSGVLTNRLSPYSPLCAVPLPDSLLLEPGYIHRRNERERDRVRSLNEGYDRLKERLPLRNKDKRISKVMDRDESECMLTLYASPSVTSDSCAAFSETLEFRRREHLNFPARKTCKNLTKAQASAIEDAAALGSARPMRVTETTAAGISSL